MRALRLPLWWVFFPPLFESVLDLNADVLILALLLGGPVMGGAAVICKIYAVVPLLLQRRWTALAWAIPFALLSLPWWPMYIEQRQEIMANLAQQAGSLSAWGTWLMIPTAIALVMLRGRGASWLAVPTLWPSTQLHYSTVALPAAKRSPFLAFLSASRSHFPPVAVIAGGVPDLRHWGGSRNGPVAATGPRETTFPPRNEREREQGGGARPATGNATMAAATLLRVGITRVP